MGSDPATSVVDATQKAHGHPNLYLLGSGNWSSYATGNPTLTIAALALWAADTIAKRLSQ
jgi:choline dehydrogenase-like flavoprotein